MLICLTLWKCDSKKPTTWRTKSPQGQKRVGMISAAGGCAVGHTNHKGRRRYLSNFFGQTELGQNLNHIEFIYIIVNDCWLHVAKTKHSRKVFLAKVTNLGSSSVWPRPLGELERRELAGRQPCSHRGWGHRPHGGGRGGAGPETFGCSVRNKSLIFGIDALQTLLHLSLSLSLSIANQSSY